MTTLLDSMTRTLTPNLTKEFATTLGWDERQTTQGIDVAVPLLLAAAANKVSTPEGADEVLGSLEPESQNPSDALDVGRLRAAVDVGRNAAGETEGEEGRNEA